MRSLADLQRSPGAMPPGRPQLPLQVQQVRTFDTPEFAGMQFLEVQTKTALNKVKGMMFPWSINPYRGCSHACSYCLWGDTDILMADSRTKPLADVRVGDEVYGTIGAGPYRRYVITKVLDHWQTVKPAYRVTLADGTQLIASADHRFLSNRGWKHVVGAEQGPLQRPFLTTNNRLIGTGQFAEPPKETEEYRRGYLCGMIRGDGLVRFAPYTRANGAQWTQHQFRLALIDQEGLERTGRYLRAFGVETGHFVFNRGDHARQPLNAIRTQRGATVAAIREFIAWPDERSDDWAKGFLAGIFDAEGSCSGVIRFSNTDPVVLDAIADTLDGFGFDHVLESPDGRCPTIRVRGGLRERLRFFHTTDPAIRRKCNLEGRAVKGPADLRVVSIEPLGIEMPMYDITTGTGDFIANGVISHNCFARPTHAYLNLSPLGDFEKTVVVKTNVVEVLRRELAKPSWKGEHVAMGTNTDPYQRCEGRYRLMPGIIEALADSRTPFSILTKGTLITRDLDRLRDAATQVPVTAAMTIGMLDEQVWRDSEPGTPSPAARLHAVKTLNDAGIPTGVMLAPIMPGLNDDAEQLAELVDRAAAAGASHITPIVLHLRPGVREVFWPWLEREHPELVERYFNLYRRSEAAKEYRDAVTAFVARQRTVAWRRHGKPKAAALDGRRARDAWRAKDGQPGTDRGEQLSLL